MLYEQLITPNDMLWKNSLLQHRFNTYTSSLSSQYSFLFFALSVPPSIRAGPRAMKVQVGHAIDLPCVAQGVPEPSVSWLKDGSALLDGSQYKISDEALTLNQVGLIDEGVYTCVASNIAGQYEATIQLHVQGQMDAGIYNCDYSYPRFKLTKNPMYCLRLSTVPPVVEVSEPPFNSPLQERVANQQIAFPCPAKGEPASEL